MKCKCWTYFRIILKSIISKEFLNIKSKKRKKQNKTIKDVNKMDINESNKNYIKNEILI